MARSRKAAEPPAEGSSCHGHCSIERRALLARSAWQPNTASTGSHRLFAAHHMPAALRLLPSLLCCTSSMCLLAQVLQILMHPQRNGLGCLFFLLGRLCRVSAAIGCIQCYRFMLDCCCCHADGILQALLLFELHCKVGAIVGLQQCHLLMTEGCDG